MQEISKVISERFIKLIYKKIEKKILKTVRYFGQILVTHRLKIK